MELTPYHVKYVAYELTKRSPSDSVEKFASTLVDIQAQVDLNPHQVEAAVVISQKWANRKWWILIIASANLKLEKERRSLEQKRAATQKKSNAARMR